MDKTLFLLVLLLATVAALPSGAIPSVVQPGVANWVNAAKTGRADLFLLGDSIAQSLDAGFSNAAFNRFGLAGTGTASDTSGGYVGSISTPRYVISPPFP